MDKGRIREKERNSEGMPDYKGQSAVNNKGRKGITKGKAGTARGYRIKDRIVTSQIVKGK